MRLLPEERQVDAIVILGRLNCWDGEANNRVPKQKMRVARQNDLFEKAENEYPEGFRYKNDLISPAEEQEFLRNFADLPFKEFEFQGFVGRRRVVSFGWRYDFNGGGLCRTDPLPEFLLPLRERAARFALIDPSAIEHILVTEYRPGAAIGWHKDRPDFDDVLGISLLSPCVFRFRRKIASRWDRRSFEAQPRSCYLLRGPSRSEWEHSIPAMKALRYSVTFRTLNAGRAP